MNPGLFPELKDVPDPWPDWFTPGKRTPRTFMKNVRQGRHPMGFPLDQDDPKRTCGSCGRMYRVQPTGARTYLKCDQIAYTRGPGTDIRAKWRACVRWRETS